MYSKTQKLFKAESICLIKSCDSVTTFWKVVFMKDAIVLLDTFDHVYQDSVLGNWEVIFYLRNLQITVTFRRVVR